MELNESVEDQKYMKKKFAHAAHWVQLIFILVREALAWCYFVQIAHEMRLNRDSFLGFSGVNEISI